MLGDCEVMTLRCESQVGKLRDRRFCPEADFDRIRG